MALKGPPFSFEVWPLPFCVGGCFCYRLPSSVKHPLRLSQGVGEGAFLFYCPLQALRPSGSSGGLAGLLGAGLSACRCGVPSPGISGGPEAGVDCRLSDSFAVRSGKSPFFFFSQIWGLLACLRRSVVSAQFFRIDVFPVRGSPVRSCRSFFRCRSGRRSLSGGSQEAERAGDLWAGIRRLSNWQAGQVWLHFAKLASGASCG